MRPWRPPFHASPAARKGPISSKRVSSQDPLLRKFGNFSLNSLNFHSDFSSKIWKFSAHKPPNLEIFSSQAPKFGNFSLTSPPFQRQMSVRKPHTSEIRAAHPYLKKSWVPPPRDWALSWLWIQCLNVQLPEWPQLAIASLGPEWPKSAVYFSGCINIDLQRNRHQCSDQKKKKKKKKKNTNFDTGACLSMTGVKNEQTCIRLLSFITLDVFHNYLY